MLIDFYGGSKILSKKELALQKKETFSAFIDEESFETEETYKKESSLKSDVKTYSDEDAEVMNLYDKIVFIISCHDKGENWIDKPEFVKMYTYLEKGYELSIYQKNRIKNAYTFARRAKNALAEE